MNFFEIIDAFQKYSIDVLLLAFATTAFVSILKHTVLKNAKKKILTFLPFIIGIIFYGVYQGVINCSFNFVLENYTIICEGGLTCGTVSTVYYILYEQFIRERSDESLTESLIKKLLTGVVETDKLLNVSESLFKILSTEKSENEQKTQIFALLKTECANMSTSELSGYTSLILNAVKTIK